MRMRFITVLVVLLICGSLFANSDAENTRAFSLYKEKKYDEAIAICNTVLQKDPKNTDAIYIAAVSHFMLKNYLVAEGFFSKFLEINPYNYDVIRYRAICEYYNGKYKESILSFEKIPKYMDDPVSLIYLALNYNRLMDKGNLALILKKIETHPALNHKNKQEFLSIINKAMESDLQTTTSLLERMRDEYNNPFIISSKIISIEKSTKKETEKRLRLMLALNETFDTNVALYPDKDAIKLPDIKYGERYDYRTEVRYSIGYKILDTTSNIFGIVYNGYHGINSSLHQFNFNANDLMLNYRYSRNPFYLGMKYNYNYDFISNDFRAYDFGHQINPEFGFKIGDRSSFAIGTSALLRHYFEDIYSADFDRSGFLVDPYLYYSYSIDAGLVLFKRNSFGISLSDGDAWKYMRPELRLGITYKFGRSISLFATTAYSYYMFSEKISNPDYFSDISVEARNDSKIVFETGIDIRLYSDQLYLNCGYALLVNMSNVRLGLYNYSRHIGSLGIKFAY